MSSELFVGFPCLVADEAQNRRFGAPLPERLSTPAPVCRFRVSNPRCEIWVGTGAFVIMRSIRSNALRLCDDPVHSLKCARLSFMPGRAPLLKMARSIDGESCFGAYVEEFSPCRSASGNSSRGKIRRRGRRAALRLPASRLRRLLDRRMTTAIATGTAPNDGERKWRIFVK